MDWSAIALSLRLAATVSVILLLLGTPIAYWLAFSRWRWKFLVEAVVALPLVLPPTVLGFYVLVAIGNRSPLGRAWLELVGTPLAACLLPVFYKMGFAAPPSNNAYFEITLRAPPR